MVSKLLKVIASKYYTDRYWNYNSTTKVNGILSYESEWNRCCFVLKVTWKWCDDFYLVNNQNTQNYYHHFQDVAQKSMHNNILDSFASHFAKKITQKLIPQQFCKIISFRKMSTVNPFGSIKKPVVNHPLLSAWIKESK